MLEVVKVNKQNNCLHFFIIFFHTDIFRNCSPLSVYDFSTCIFHTHTHTLTKEYSSEIYLYEKKCDFLMFTAVTYNKVVFLMYICICIIYIFWSLLHELPITDVWTDNRSTENTGSPNMGYPIEVLIWVVIKINDKTVSQSILASQICFNSFASLPVMLLLFHIRRLLVF